MHAWRCASRKAPTFDGYSARQPPPKSAWASQVAAGASAAPTPCSDLNPFPRTWYSRWNTRADPIGEHCVEERYLVPGPAQQSDRLQRGERRIGFGTQYLLLIQPREIRMAHQDRKHHCSVSRMRSECPSPGFKFNRSGFSGWRRCREAHWRTRLSIHHPRQGRYRYRILTHAINAARHTNAPHCSRRRRRF